MRKLFTILSAVAITIGLGVPAGAATRSSGRTADSGHSKAQHGDKDRDRHVKQGDHDGDRHVKQGDHDRDRHAKQGDHDRDRHVNDRDHDGDRDRQGHDRDHDRDRDRRDFSGRRHHHSHYHDGHYYPYYPYYDDYYYDRYDYDGYDDGGYGYGYGYGYGDCDDGRPPAGVVVIRCIAFNPPRIHVAVGQDVVWSWQDGGTPHTVTADDGSFDSGRRTGGDLRVTFNHPGHFTYHCRVHPRMAGSVIVG